MIEIKIKAIHEGLILESSATIAEDNAEEIGDALRYCLAGISYHERTIAMIGDYMGQDSVYKAELDHETI